MITANLKGKRRVCKIGSIGGNTQHLVKDIPSNSSMIELILT